MKVKHEIEISRRCPVNDGFDDYVVIVETDRLIIVEDILAAIDALPERDYQEAITRVLACRLKCSVTTIGRHSGVLTTCTC